MEASDGSTLAEDIKKFMDMLPEFAPPPSYMREAMATLGISPEMLGMDFSKLEDRAVAMLIKDGIVVRHITANDKLQGKEATFIMLDEFYDNSPDPEKKPYVSFKDQPFPVKQDGRSAAYLAFDKTKHHGRKRK